MGHGRTGAGRDRDPSAMHLPRRAEDDGRPRRRGGDAGHLLALEGVVVAALLFGAVMFLLASGDPPGLGVSTREEVARLTDDAVRVFAKLPVSDERYDGRFLDMAVAAALSGDPSHLESKMERLLPEAAQYNVYLDNGHRTQVLAGSRTPTGERVSSATAFVPVWSPVFVSTDFDHYSEIAGTPMRVTAWPLYHGRLLADDPYLSGGDMEADADGNGVPDGWAPDPAAAASVETDASRVWRLDLAAAGRGGYASETLAAPPGTGFEVTAAVKGGRACVRFAYLDASLAPADVDGVTTECVATLAAPSLLAFEDVSGTRFLPDSTVAFVRVELVLLDPGTSWFDDVVVRPVARAMTDNGVELPLRRTGASQYTGTQSVGGYATGAAEVLAVDARWRGQALTGNVTYATSAATLLPVAWADAVAGLDASTLTASAAAVNVGEAVTLDFDFAPYGSALAANGVTLTAPQVRIRVYGPVVSPGGEVTLLETLDAPAGTLTGSLTYAHAGDGLYGPLFVEASVESGWAKFGHADVAGQAGHKALLLEGRMRNGDAAIPPLYRIVVETWFPEW